MSNMYDMKFCSQCGQKLEPGARFCSQCGKPCAGGGNQVTPPNGPTGGTQTFHPENVLGKIPPFKVDNSPLGQIKDLCGGTMGLVFTGLFALGVVIQFFASLSSGMTFLTSLASQVFAILFAVGFCMNAWGARTGQLRDSGFTLISGTLLARIIFLLVGCAGCAICMLIFMIVLIKAGEAGTGIGLFLGAILVIGLFLALAYYYYAGLRNVALSAREIVRTGSGTVQVSQYAAILLFVVSGLQFIGAVVKWAMYSVIQESLSALTSQLYYVSSDLYDILNSVFYSGLRVSGVDVFVTLLLAGAQVIGAVMLMQLRKKDQVAPPAQQGTRYSQW